MKQSPHIPSTCRKCKADESVITVRLESLCRDCFCRYVSTKIVKRMETFRVRYSEPGCERILLLPLSFGHCSTALLHILSQYSRGQVKKTGRTGFRLHLLHVNEDAEADAEVTMEKLREQYPEHIYSSAHVADVLLADDISPLAKGSDCQHTALLPSSIYEASTRSERLNHIMSSLNSPTSQADMLQILRQRLIVRFAKANNCEAVLWGHCTTRLAERTLAETAKGRGSSLPWVVSDGKSVHDVSFYYPLREVLHKEIVAYTSLAHPALVDLVSTENKPNRSTKKTTIDDLMRQYFESVEREYPSIVANVVRTTGKLEKTLLSQIGMLCELCKMPLNGQSPEKSRLCYGCIRTLSIPTG